MVSQVFDRLSAPLANAIGMSPQDVSEALGNELLALGIEVPSNFLLTTTGRVIEDVILGAVFLGLSSFSRLDGRSRKDLLELGSHFLNDAADEVSDPARTTQFLNELQGLTAGTRTGDLGLVSQTFLRTPGAIRAWLDQITLSIRGLAGGAPAVTVTPPLPVEEAVQQATASPYRRIE